MARFKILLEYDGTRYAGWQVQKNARTVQGELLEAAFTVFETQQLEFYGAGRTDAGVHARGQVAHLDVNLQRLPAPEQLLMRLNDQLSHDINILAVEKTHPRFHARHDARRRHYTYQISKRRDAFAKKYVWWIRDPLDLQRMRQAAAPLLGFHDFRSFGEADADEKSTLVEMTRLELIENEERLYIHLSASHFLWKMVRRIVGTLVEVGRGKLPADITEQWLETPSKEAARLTAPPSGLFLEKIDY